MPKFCKEYSNVWAFYSTKLHPDDGHTYSGKLLVFLDFMFGSDQESPSWLISSHKLVLVNGRSSVPTGVEGKLIAELSRFSVDKIFFSLIYQFWNVYFIMYLHSLC